jgi:hypothetical protein
VLGPAQLAVDERDLAADLGLLGKTEHGVHHLGAAMLRCPVAYIGRREEFGHAPDDAGAGLPPSNAPSGPIRG